MTNGRQTTPARARKGFRLHCPLCSEDDAEIELNLKDLTTCKCVACGDEFSITTALKRLSDQLAAWASVARWVESAASLTAAPETEASE